MAKHIIKIASIPILFLSVVLCMSYQAQSAVITFSGMSQAWGRDPGTYWGSPSSNYQPLEGGYVVGSVVDGGDLGIHVDMTQFVSDHGGHTGDGLNDYFLKMWSSSGPWAMTFDQPVIIHSFWMKADYNAGTTGSFLAYTSAADTSPVATIDVTNTGTSWIEITGLDDHPITKLALSLTNGNVLFDDIDISAAPEPASSALLLLACGGVLMFSRGRNTTANE